MMHFSPLGGGGGGINGVGFKQTITVETATYHLRLHYHIHLDNIIHAGSYLRVYFNGTPIWSFDIPENPDPPEERDYEVDVDTEVELTGATADFLVILYADSSLESGKGLTCDIDNVSLKKVL